MNDIIAWLSPTLAGLTVWLAHKLYESLSERFETAKSIVNLQRDLEALRGDVKACNRDVFKVSKQLYSTSESVDSSMSHINQQIREIHSQLIIADKKLTTALNKFDSQQKDLENFGRVIHALVKRVSGK